MIWGLRHPVDEDEALFEPLLDYTFEVVFVCYCIFIVP